MRDKRSAQASTSRPDCWLRLHPPGHYKEVYHFALTLERYAPNYCTRQILDTGVTLNTEDFIQIISCKLLLNLVDCIRQRSESEASQGQDSVRTGQDLLMRMLEVFVIKFKTIAKLQLPILIQKSKAQQATAPAQTSATTQSIADSVKTEDGKPSITSPPTIIEPLATAKTEERDAGKSKFGFPPSLASSYTVADCRSLVKTLVCGVKAITWRCASFKQSSSSVEGGKLFTAKETEVFIRLVKWAMQALDIYTLSITPTAAQPTGLRQAPQQTVRTKEEKEVLEHFSGVVSILVDIGEQYYNRS
ncbi:hypothetical protein J6590_046317 [Homalodisca vitripennis]|nr:hypothetical protein J6590_046317 [Homalodisca vitripennis]